ncbi:MAG: polyprenyl synthetase family protein [Streptomyces sp.]
MRSLSTRDGDPTDWIKNEVVADLAARWPESAEGVGQLIRYALAGKGKLLRPLLVCHSALVVGGELERVLPAASGIECVHTGSLLHDDIIDGDTVRRGRPAVHASFGHDRAILAGNALYFAWFTALADCAQRGVADHLIRQAMVIQAQAGVEACRGAVDELTLTGRPDCGTDAYLDMARRKTAALLAAACRTGAVLAEASPAQEAALATYGENLGLAFQIRDDLLPYTAAPHRLGKPADSDLRNLRPTLPVILAWQAANPADRAALRDVFTDVHSSDLDDTMHRLKHILTRTGALEYARQAADQHADQARAALDGLTPSAYIRALRDFTFRPA